MGGWGGGGGAGGRGGGVVLAGIEEIEIEKQVLYIADRERECVRDRRENIFCVHV